MLGSTSFAGGDFVDVLLECGRYEVLGIGRSPEPSPAFRPYGARPRDGFAYHQLDLARDFERVRRALDDFAPSLVVNFAAQGDESASWTYPADFFETNVTALARLVDHLKGSSYLRRFVQISSAGVYGGQAGPHKENSRLAPGSPYSVSKAAADMLLSAYYRHFGFPAVTIRPPNLYGPYQQPFRIIPKAIVLLKRGERVELHGGGRTMRAFLYVRDASRAVLAVLEGGRPGGVYNLSPDEVYTIRDIVTIVCDTLGCEFRCSTLDVEERLGQESRVDIVSNRIRDELAWQPKTSLREGIERTKDWVDREWRELASIPLTYQHRR